MAEKKSDYEEYLEKYCRTRGVPKEEAEKHYLVRSYKDFCEKREKEDAGYGPTVQH